MPAPATDNHPFLYLRTDSIPGLYLVTLALILAVAIVGEYAFPVPKLYLEGQVLQRGAVTAAKAHINSTDGQLVRGDEARRVTRVERDVADQDDDAGGLYLFHYRATVTER